jgi:hypothetical protein
MAPTANTSLRCNRHEASATHSYLQSYVKRDNDKAFAIRGDDHRCDGYVYV